MDKYTREHYYFDQKQENKSEEKKKNIENDQDFIPQNLRIEKKEIKQKRKRKPRECYRLWDSEENKIFLQFLTLHKSDFEDLEARRSNKVFVNMAHNFNFRNSHQCKSHYQKLQKMTKQKTISEVIKLLQKKLKKQKVLFQRIIKGNQLIYPKQTQYQQGSLNIFYIKEKFFEIHVHVEHDKISLW